MTAGLGQNEAGLSHWRRAGRLFEVVVELPEGEREAFLERHCGAEPELLRAVRDLLAFDVEDPEAEILASARIAPGRDLGGYRLLEPIAQGGMASVWLGERSDGEVQQRVAIKWIEAGGHPWIAPLFRRERQILARLEHPNIARFLDGGTTEEGLLFAVLEYVQGVPLTRFCDLRRLSVDRRLELFLKVCAAVQYAHQSLVVHRDLKPDNILVGDDGEPKLLDFGIAKPLLPSRLPATPGATVTVGPFLTPAYSSPEQLAGEPAATAADTYSLGVLLHELLTGCLPRGEGRLPPGGQMGDEESASGVRREAGGEAFLAPSERAFRGLAVNGETPESRATARATTPSRLRRRLRGDLDAIVQRCLRIDPRRRYGSVEQLGEDLRRHLAGLPVAVQPPSLRYRCTKFFQRNRLAVSLGVVLALGALAFVAVTFIYSRRVERERVRAEQERDAARLARDEAEAVQQFLLDAFRSADPYQRADLGEKEPREITVPELLERSAERIPQALRGRPLVQARLYQSLGGVYLNLARYEKALPLLRESLAIRQRELGPDHPDVETSLGLLGHALLTIGRLEEAEPVLRETLRLTRKLRGAPPQTLAETLTNLGMLDDDLGRLPEAEAALREAVAIYHRSYAPAVGRDRPLAITDIQLGSILYQRKAYTAAQEPLQEALSILRERGLAEHPDVASALHYLAKIDQAEGRFDDGEARFRQALAMRVKTQGADHPQAIVARAALGKLLLARGAFAEAETLFREVEKLDGKVYGARSAQVAEDRGLVAQAAAVRAASAARRNRTTGSPR